MSIREFITGVRPLSTLPGVGTVVRTSRGVGLVTRVKVSPYYAEEREGIQRAYVISASVVPNSWADWCLPHEIEVL